MDRIGRRNLSVILIAVSAAVVVCLIAVGFAAGETRENPAGGYVLRAYNNTVALYNGENEIVEVYDGIVLNTLPDADVRQLTNGIAFSTKAEALRTVEDYDG